MSASAPVDGFVAVVSTTPARLAPPAILAALMLGLALVALLAISLGRYPVSPPTVAQVLLHKLLAWPATVGWTSVDEQVVWDVRLPRVAAAMLVGSGLAVCGTALQGVYRNPLVDPSIVGAAPGAAFGGAAAILLFGGGEWVVPLAFAGGLLAMALVQLIAGLSGRFSVLALVLAGVVVGAFFTALVSLTQYLANPETTLPAIVYWLMGSFATANWHRIATAAPLIGLSALALLALRFRIDLLSLGDEEARALGVRAPIIRAAVLVLVALIAASVVSTCGIVGWVGLLAPHLARMAVGPAHRVLLPASALGGALLLVVVDTIARTATAAEIPLSVITALVGAPVFALLLHRLALQGWNKDRE